jgi:2,4-dienoyl-CoA reductase (NADPH2)
MEIGQAAGVDNAQCLTPDEGRGIARLLQDAGADMIHVRSTWLGYHVGGYLTDVFFYPEPPVPVESMPAEYYSRSRGTGANMTFAEGIKHSVSIPVMTVSKISPELGEKLLRQGKVDFIGMTRMLQADPELPNKLITGREEDIAPCTACENCLGSQRCRINAFMGKEYNVIEKTGQRKKVMVVGGGPAGMEAARVAALRGHDVSLYEKQGRLGGLLPVAAVVKGTDLENIPDIVTYLERQIKQLGVGINLGKEVDLPLIERTKPDVVILATGGIPVMPDIPGIKNKKVISTTKLQKKLRSFMKFFGSAMLRNLSKLYLPVGKKIVIIGTGLQGCELAEFFVRRGRQVTLVDKAERPGGDMVDVLFGYLSAWLEKQEVVFFNSVREYTRINKDGLIIVDKAGKEVLIEADSIIPALPLAPDTRLLPKLKKMVPEVYAVGDCKEPLLIADAINSGMTTAREV